MDLDVVLLQRCLKLMKWVTMQENLDFAPFGSGCFENLALIVAKRTRLRETWNLKIWRWCTKTFNSSEISQSSGHICVLGITNPCHWRILGLLTAPTDKGTASNRWHEWRVSGSPNCVMHRTWKKTRSVAFSGFLCENEANNCHFDQTIIFHQFVFCGVILLAKNFWFTRTSEKTKCERHNCVDDNNQTQVSQVQVWCWTKNNETLGCFNTFQMQMGQPKKQQQRMCNVLQCKSTFTK